MVAKKPEADDALCAWRAWRRLSLATETAWRVYVKAQREGNYAWERWLRIKEEEEAVEAKTPK